MAGTAPNVVLCVCDQLRAFATGCYGNRICRTPHLDRLAREGVRVETAVSNNPVCMPARSVMLSGQYARTCMGMLTNFTCEEPGVGLTMPERPYPGRPHLPDPTLAEAFQAAGYHTAAIGKWHIHSAPHDVGFQYSLIPRVHHRHTGQHFIENGGDEVRVDEFGPEFESQRVRQFLTQRKSSGRPFFLYYNISPPHMPLDDAPDRYLSMYRPSQMPLRPNVYKDGKLPAGDAADRWFRIYLWDFRFYMLGEPHTATLPDGFDLRHLVALYYGMTTWVDDLLGRLLLALDEQGLSRDTIVLFTSDHGDNLGSHHLFNKDRLIEESIRVPLVCRAPGRIPAGVTSRRISSLVDIMPTVLDLASVEVPSTVQGISRAEGWRQDGTDLPPSGEAFIETTHDGIGIRTPGHTCGIRMDAQTRRLEPSAHLLYDVAHDPYQTRNLADRREHEAVRRDLEEQIREFHARTPWMQVASTDVGTVS